MKSANWISAIGRSPSIAIPIATPTIEASASGVSTTRCGPNSSRNPFVMRKTLPRAPTSSPMIRTRSSRSSASWSVERTASTLVITVVPDCCCAVAVIVCLLGRGGSKGARSRAPRLVRAVDHVLVERRGARVRLRFGGIGGVVGLAQDVLAQRLDPRLVDDPRLDDHLLEARDRIELAALFDDLARAVGAVVVVGRVRQEPIALRLDDRGPAAGSRALERLVHRLVRRDRIEAVAHHAGDSVAGRLVGHVGDAHLHRLRRRDGPLVVLAKKDDGKRVNRRVVHRLVPLALRGRALAGRAQDGPPALVAVFERRCDPDRVRAVSRDDRGDRRDAEVVVRVVVRELTPARAVGRAREHRGEDLEGRHPDPERETEVAVVRNQDVAAAREGHRRACLHRFVSLGAEREGDLPLTVQLEAAVVELPLEQHVPKHRDQLFVGQAGAVELAPARGRGFCHRVDPQGMETLDGRRRASPNPAGPMSPLSAASLHSRAVAAFVRRDYAEAEALLLRLLAGNAADRAARFNLGKVYEVTERYEAAAAAYEAIVANTPDDVAALLRLGTVRYVQDRYEDAAAAFADALRASPGDATAALNLGIVLNGLGRCEAAVRVLREAVDAHPELSDARCALAEALRELRRDGEAEAQALAVLERDPANVSARVIVGQIAYDRGDFDAAERAFAAAAEAAPDRAEPRLNLGVLLHGLGRYDEALAHAEAAVALAPDDPLAHFDLGLTLLLGERYERGFAEAEWRLRDPRTRARLARFDAIPRWDGAPLNGGTLLVAREQGLGDFLLWARLFPELKRRSGAHVVVETPPALGRLADALPGIDGAHALGVREPVAPAQPYLRAGAAATARFGARFAPAPGELRIGIAWAGDPAHLLDRFRSCALEDFAALAGVPNVRWFSLQKGPREDEALHPPPGVDLVALGPELVDLDDTAAAIAALDLVIAVDTSVVHLAGALGRPVWMLHGFGNYWLWGLRRADSPWYPSLRIFRQRRAGVWSDVFADVRTALEAFASTRDANAI